MGRWGRRANGWRNNEQFLGFPFPCIPPRGGVAWGLVIRNGTRMMIFNRKYIPIRRIKLNETDLLENQEDNEQDVSSSETSDITEEKDITPEQETESPVESQQDNSDTTALVEQVTYINQKLDTVTNILLVSMVGIGVLVGVITCNIFSRYFKA